MAIQGNFKGSVTDEILLRGSRIHLELQYVHNVHGDFFEVSASTAFEARLVQYPTVNPDYQGAQSVCIWVLSLFLLRNNKGAITLAEINRAVEKFLQAHRDSFVN